MARVAIGGQAETFEVDMWGETFEAKPATRSVAAKGEPIIAKLTDVSDTNEAVNLYGQILDLRLAPTNGHKTKASTVLRRQWEADKVTIKQIDQFVEQLAEADRPT